MLRHSKELSRGPFVFAIILPELILPLVVLISFNLGRNEIQSHCCESVL